MYKPLNNTTNKISDDTEYWYDEFLSANYRYFYPKDQKQARKKFLKKIKAKLKSNIECNDKAVIQFDDRYLLGLRIKIKCGTLSISDGKTVPIIFIYENMDEMQCIHFSECIGDINNYHNQEIYECTLENAVKYINGQISTFNKNYITVDKNRSVFIPEIISMMKKVGIKNVDVKEYDLLKGVY